MSTPTPDPTLVDDELPAVDEGPHPYTYEVLLRREQVEMAQARLLALERELAGLSLAEAEAAGDPHMPGNADDRVRARETIEGRAEAVKAWLRGAAVD